MATTETRTGFRLPWAADRTSSREADELDGPRAVENEADRGPDPEDRAPDAQVDPAAPGGELGGSTPDASPAHVAAPEAHQGTTPASAGAPARRPTKFMADLMKAMHTAAEEARSGSLEQFRHDGQAFVEQIHARSATQVEDLRRRTDDDVTGIKDWSKAEIARVREETEERITARRQQLEGQLERQAALVEREIEKVRAKVAGYEAEMQAFFDKMLAEEDPTFFAALAAQMPEPPTFEEIDEEALDELLREPEPVVAPEVEVAAVETAATTVETAGTPVEATAEPEATAVDEPVIAAESAEPATAESAEPGELETAMAAIQAAAEAAATSEPGDGTQVVAEPAAETGTDETPTEPDSAAEPGVDPRIAMLGLTPDFAAAEAEAAASASAYAGEGIDEMGEDTVSARLAGLVQPAAGAAPDPASTVTSQVVVVGLVSVASIASFKRHLGRLAGVAHVGVSSGPDGEFVYTVTHDPAASLAELIPTIPGFGARVTGSGDGFVNVSAGDPEA